MIKQYILIVVVKKFEKLWSSLWNDSLLGHLKVYVTVFVLRKLRKFIKTARHNVLSEFILKSFCYNILLKLHSPNNCISSF